MSKRAAAADTTGILNLHKPVGPTSHDMVRKVRWLLQMKRVGHAGTLDPLAAGVLVVAAGRATRLLEYVVGRPKVYLAAVTLGQTSTTYDGEGEISPARPVTVTRAEIEAVLAHFCGEIEQIPPMHSAVKKDGQPLYKLARQGKEVAREPRAITIYELEIDEWRPPLLRLRVTCSAGTYIRSLAHDVGEALGIGGYLSGLLRTAVGSFTLDNAVELEALTRENVATFLQPLDQAAAHLPALAVDAGSTTDLINGRKITRTSADPEAELVRAYDPDGTFIGILAPLPGQWKPHKIFYQ